MRVVFNAHINLFDTGIPGRCDLFQTGTGSEIFTGCTASTGVIMANNQYTNTVPITEAAIAQANTRCYAKTSGSRFTCDSIQLAGVGLDNQECFNEEYPCDSCCSTGLTPNGNNCWDENFTQISCCGSESLSLEVGVIGVTQDNKDQVCDSIAGALGGSATHCSLAGPQSGRRRLTGGTTLFMDVTLSDPSSAPSQTIDSNFVGSLSGLPRGVAVTSVSTTNAESESVWYPNYYASWVDGHCLNSASTGVDSTFLASVSNYGTREECCSAAYGGQTSGACLREVWYPNYSASWVDGHCLNSASTGVDSRFLVSYATREECCSAAYAGQTSGACLREDLDSTDPFCANAIYDSNYALLSWSDCVGNEYSDAYDAMATGGWPCGCASGCVINGDGTSGGCQGHDPSSTTPYNSCVCPDNESSGRSRGPAEPCTMILCQNGCDLINTDANGCGGECSCPADPIKEATVKRLFKRISEALEKTSNIIRKVTDRLKRKVVKGSMYDSNAMDKVEWLNTMSRDSDWNSWINGAMTRIDSFGASYRDDGTPKGNLNGQDAMYKGAIKNLLRLSSYKHLRGMRVELNRLMNRIYDQDDGAVYNSFDSTLKTRVDHLNDSTQNSHSLASAWLVDAAAFYKALEQDYNFNGEPKN